ncbi:hypothetical protein E2C01_011819 [Portunus trituberculatus]|uniref:Uncharacterized protein n=1 Tax=Portunus trituberculatus TaxID=210409 RepID=A0A5B7DC60_PORTR|nr:hypothetical protein [Portunus trituberculatus]
MFTLSVLTFLTPYLNTPYVPGMKDALFCDTDTPGIEGDGLTRHRTEGTPQGKHGMRSQGTTKKARMRILHPPRASVQYKQILKLTHMHPTVMLSLVMASCGQFIQTSDQILRVSMMLQTDHDIATTFTPTHSFNRLTDI